MKSYPIGKILAKDETQTATIRHKHIVILLFISSFLALTAFCILTFYMEGRLRPTRPKTAQTETPVHWELERLYYDGDNHYYTIDGWAFIPQEEISSYDCHILLQNSQTKEFVQLPGIQVPRKDLTERFPELFDSAQAMTESGFRSVFDCDKLKGPFEQYTIFIQYRNNGHDILINTQRRLDQF